MKPTIPNEVFEEIFAPKIELKHETIFNIAKKLNIPISKSDFPPDIQFMRKEERFISIYPIHGTTTEQFSMLVIFFTIRQKQGLKSRDKSLTYHIRSIQKVLRNKRHLTAEQFDFWRWFQRRLDIS